MVVGMMIGIGPDAFVCSKINERTTRRRGDVETIREEATDKSEGRTTRCSPTKRNDDETKERKGEMRYNNMQSIR